MITLSGGGGHVQATKAKYKQIKELQPNTRFLFCDILIDTFGQKIGKFFLWQWNSAQENGDVHYQEWLRITGLPIAEKLFWIPIFFKILYTLIRNPITKIIDTQILGTSAVVKALTFISFFTKRKIAFEKIITELPSEHVKHFTQPIKNLSKKEKQYIKVSCFFSSLVAEDKQEFFWQTLCGISSTDILIDTPPLRPYFLKLMGKERTQEPLNIRIFTHSKEELRLIEKTASKGCFNLIDESPYLSITIEPKDFVSIIMLGSRPHEKATLNYVSNYIEICKNAKDKNRRDLLFVFCRNYDEKPHSLFKRVENLIAFEHDYPETLTVIPMPFQDDEVIAPLFFRSDMTFTRAGGITAMELLSVCRGNIWIHTENLDRFSHKHSAGMPIWEEGNAAYLMQRKGARFITPDTFFQTCKEFFSTDERENKDNSREKESNHFYY
ncbi:MAG: hypothetical protein K9M07_03565 [Simkaniaceae bacterium]|nr:hypothetical protein [Simkaniaceae bacterium]